MLLSELGINSCGDFKKVLVEFLEFGLFESDKVQAIIERYVAEAKAFEVRQSASTLIKKAIWDRRATDADLIAEVAGFPSVVDQLDPYVTTELHGILGELAGGQTIAKLNSARSLKRSDSCSLILIAQISPSLNGSFCPTSLHLFQGTKSFPVSMVLFMIPPCSVESESAPRPAD